MRACLNQCRTGEGWADANRGFICEKCYDRIAEALPKAPRLIVHLREIFTMQSRNEDGAQRIKKDPPAPFNLYAWDLAEQMFYALTENQMRVNWDIEQLGDVVQTEANRILTNLPTLANTRHIQSLLALPKLTLKAEIAFPMKVAARKTALPCPNCNKRTIYQPPQHYLDNIEVVCFDCGFRIPPEKVEFYARLAEKEAAND
jgi:predicted RNA-binding Zn-ribbon protein involved in translation (DUF1610 family)